MEEIEPGLHVVPGRALQTVCGTTVNTQTVLQLPPTGLFVGEVFCADKCTVSFYSKAQLIKVEAPDTSCEAITEGR